MNPKTQNLGIDGWVEARVKHDAAVGAREVDAQAAGLGGEQKHFDFAFVVECLDHVLACGCGRRAVDAVKLAVAPPARPAEEALVKEAFQQIQRLHALRHNDHLVALLQALVQQRKQHHHLAAVLQLSGRVVRSQSALGQLAQRRGRRCLGVQVLRRRRGRPCLGNRLGRRLGSQEQQVRVIPN